MGSSLQEIITLKFIQIIIKINVQNQSTIQHKNYLLITSMESSSVKRNRFLIGYIDSEGMPQNKKHITYISTNYYDSIADESDSSSDSITQEQLSTPQISSYFIKTRQFKHG